jgi:hypothetical protein
MQKVYKFSKITLFLEFMEIYEKIGDRSILHLDNLNVFDERFVSYKSAISAYFEELRRKNPVVKEEDENTSYVIRSKTKFITYFLGVCLPNY